jgi:hypothetical protein
MIKISDSKSPLFLCDPLLIHWSVLLTTCQQSLLGKIWKEIWEIFVKKERKNELQPNTSSTGAGG